MSEKNEEKKKFSFKKFFFDEEPPKYVNQQNFHNTFNKWNQLWIHYKMLNLS